MMAVQMSLMTLLLFGFCLSSCSGVPQRTYFYVHEDKSWPEAQQYCREKYTDLATFESLDDISRLNADFSYTWSWFGLWDDPKSWRNTMGNDSNSWRWSTTGETSKTGFHKFNTDGTDYGAARETCVVIFSEGQWFDANCALEKTFLCYNVTEQNKKSYVFVSTPRTWSSAQTFCRENYKDLAMIENEAENTEANKTKPEKADVWIGLYRVPWTWSDKSQSPFRNWDLSSLNNGNHNQHCGTENNLHKWGDEECQTKRVFICHLDSKRTTTVKMTTVTDADLTDPATSTQFLQQLGALLTSQGLTDFKIQWTHLPSKDMKGCSKPPCDSLV